MDEYKTNSKKSKMEASVEEEKRVTTQIVGEASTKKKSKLTKFTEVFIPEDTNSLIDYILKEALDTFVTAGKKWIVSSVNRALYGNSSGNQNNKPTSSLSPSYRPYYDDRNNSVAYKPYLGSIYSFDEVEFTNVQDVERAISELKDVQRRYGFVRVSDMYEVAKLERIIRYTDNDYGWTDVSQAYWTSYVNDDHEDRYILKMPRPIPRPR